MKLLRYEMLGDEQKKTYRRLVGDAEKTVDGLSGVSIKLDKMFSWARGGQFFALYAKWKFEESKARRYLKSLAMSYGCGEIEKDSFPDYPHTFIEQVKRNR